MPSLESSVIKKRKSLEKLGSHLVVIWSNPQKKGVYFAWNCFIFSSIKGSHCRCRIFWLEMCFFFFCTSALFRHQHQTVTRKRWRERKSKACCVSTKLVLKSWYNPWCYLNRIIFTKCLFFRNIVSSSKRKP